MKAKLPEEVTDKKFFEEYKKRKAEMQKELEEEKAKEMEASYKEKI